MALSDYRQMEKELSGLGGKRIGQIGVLGGARYEAWVLNERGFLLATREGAVEIYVCGSPSTAGLAAHVEYMRQFARGADSTGEGIPTD